MLDLRFEGAASGIAVRVADENDAQIADALLDQPLGRLDQNRMAFARGKPRRQQHDAIMRRDAPRRAQPLDAAPVDGGGREGAQIRAARDDHNPLRAFRMQFSNALGGEFRNGDHRVARRHDGVVALLDRRRAAIGAVIGRDQLCAGLSRRVIGDPGGRARARMHDVDAFVADDSRKPHRIQRHREGIFRRRRKRRPDAAFRLQLADHAAAA